MPRPRLGSRTQDETAGGRYGRLVDLAPDAIFTIGLDGCYTFLNPAWAVITGWSPDELLGRPYLELVHPDDRQRVEQQFRQLLRAETVPTIQVRVRVRSGAYRVAEVRTAPEVAAGAVTAVIGVARDVTDQLRAAAALRQSEEKFVRAFRANPSPMLITRLADGVILEANEAFLKATEYTQSEVTGRPTRDLVWAEPAQRADMVRQMEAHQRVTGLEMKARTKSGKLLDWLLSLEVIQLDGVPHTIGAAVDITERKRMEEALRKSEEKFARAFRSSPDPMLITRMRDGVVVEVNDAWLSVSGYTREHAIGRSTLDLVWLEGGAREALMTRLRSEGRVAGLEMQIRNQAGSLRDGVVAIEVIQLEGEPHLLVCAKDVTEEKRVTTALRESEERFRLLVQGLTVGVLVLDRGLHIVLCNPTGVAMLGLPREQLIGKVIHDLPFEFIREDGTAFPTADHPSSVARTTGRPVHQTILGHRAAGGPDWVWHLVNADPQIGPEGEVQEIVVTFSDVTERRRAQTHLAELRESLRRTEMMSALGSLVAGVAHEVRNPLFAISATVDAFDARFGSDGQTARYIQALRREVERLSELMASLLDYGRPPNLELAEHPIGGVITRAVEQCGRLAQAAEVLTVVEVPDALPRLRLDSTRMVQVFQNLIDNAIRHSPKGGTVTVKCALTIEEGAQWVDLAVGDQGTGFPLEDLPHVFEPFFSRRHGGTGLGLSIVQRIVEQHGGRVWAENQPEGGAVMTVRLAVPPPIP
jgi:PAS domain S-box-containing protein